MDNTDNNKPKRVVGKPFPKGTSGNPGGRPKLIVEFHDALRKKFYQPALDALMQCLVSPDDKTRLMAAREVFDRLFGKPNQTVTGEGGGPVRLDIGVIDMLKKLAES